MVKVMNIAKPIIDPRTHYRITIQGRVDLDWLNSFDSSVKISLVKPVREQEKTMLDVYTDQSGIVGLVRRLHGLGLTILELQVLSEKA